MNYPLISEYIESIKASEDNFEQLKNLRPVLDDNGLPVMTSGNFAVVFKMKDEQTGKFHAVKCFLKEQEGRAEAYRQISEELEYVSSTFLTPIKYLDKELFVDTSNSDETEFPVLLMDWVEGITLDKYLRENLDDQYALEMLAYRFSLLAQWLIPQPFAHGDLKPDNILVCEDGTLVLVDYDGMYVPAMKGQKARELGSPDFRHPLRTEDDFDEHIDDFPLASILLSLKAISLNPKLLVEYGTTDRLLFSEKDYRNSNGITLLKELSLYYDVELNAINFVVNDLLYRRNSFFGDIPSLTISNIIITKPEMMRNIVTEISCKEWNDSIAFRDRNNFSASDKWAIYSKNQRKLLRFYDEDRGQCGEEIWEDWCPDYVIKTGTLVICDYAFRGCNNLCFLQIPSSVKYIGKKAFSDCWSLKSIELPDLEWISEDAFGECRCLCTIAIPKGTYAKFAKLLPNDIQQLKEINNDVCRKNIIAYLCNQEKEGNDDLNYYHRMITLFQSINSFHYYSHESSFSFHCYDNRECCVFVNCPSRIISPQFHINDVENIEEITNAIYYLLLDAGIIDMFC